MLFLLLLILLMSHLAIESFRCIFIYCCVHELRKKEQILLLVFPYALYKILATKIFFYAEFPELLAIIRFAFPCISPEKFFQSLLVEVLFSLAIFDKSSFHGGVGFFAEHLQQMIFNSPREVLEECFIFVFLFLFLFLLGAFIGKALI